MEHWARRVFKTPCHPLCDCAPYARLSRIFGELHRELWRQAARERRVEGKPASIKVRAEAAGEDEQPEGSMSSAAHAFEQLAQRKSRGAPVGARCVNEIENRLARSAGVIH
jgi:hypothetical protein